MSEQFVRMIDIVSEKLTPDVIATDGDAMRRKVFNGRDKLIRERNVRTELEKLPLFYLHIIGGARALYFDDKHNGKRFRGVLISDTRGCLVGKNVISNSHLKYVFDKAGIQNRDILHPRDLQNVPAVLSLVEALKKCIDVLENTGDQVCCELMPSVRILVQIFEGITCIFRSPEIDLIEQLRTLSTLSHVIFHQWRENGTAFMSGQLYHDIQRMVQASYYACALMRERGGGGGGGGEDVFLSIGHRPIREHFWVGKNNNSCKKLRCTGTLSKASACRSD